jgi:hypothetical protein
LDKKTAICLQSYVHGAEDFVKKLSEIPELCAILESCEQFRGWKEGDVSLGRLLYEFEDKLHSGYLSKRKWQDLITSTGV